MNQIVDSVDIPTTLGYRNSRGSNRLHSSEISPFGNGNRGGTPPSPA